ncbi:hypothetical protein [Mycoplasmopsis felifaucium]|uniref:hypothetical protein n=1 Tax=Mycoplasmopsis felifaucium TaxID=35768 RepID=UPI000ACB0A26|nr:hypothetical protein [Mycoplasmopsis felifaucium]
MLNNLKHFIDESESMQHPSISDIDQKINELQNIIKEVEGNTTPQERLNKKVAFFNKQLETFNNVKKESAVFAESRPDDPYLKNLFVNNFMDKITSSSELIKNKADEIKNASDNSTLTTEEINNAITLSMQKIAELEKELNEIKTLYENYVAEFNELIRKTAENIENFDRFYDTKMYPREWNILKTLFNVWDDYYKDIYNYFYDDNYGLYEEFLDGGYDYESLPKIFAETIDEPSRIEPNLEIRKIKINSALKDFEYFKNNFYEKSISFIKELKENIYYDFLKRRLNEIKQTFIPEWTLWTENNPLFSEQIKEFLPNFNEIIESNPTTNEEYEVINDSFDAKTIEFKKVIVDVSSHFNGYVTKLKDHFGGFGFWELPFGRWINYYRDKNKNEAFSYEALQKLPSGDLNRYLMLKYNINDLFDKYKKFISNLYTLQIELAKVIKQTYNVFLFNDDKFYENQENKNITIRGIKHGLFSLVNIFDKYKQHYPDVYNMVSEYRKQFSYLFNEINDNWNSPESYPLINEAIEILYKWINVDVVKISEATDKFYDLAIGWINESDQNYNDLVKIYEENKQNDKLKDYFKDNNIKTWLDILASLRSYYITDLGDGAIYKMIFEFDNLYDYKILADDLQKTINEIKEIIQS